MESKSIRRTVRNAFKPRGERLLEKYGILYDGGAVTPEGRKILADVVFEDYKEKVVKRLEAIEDEEKKSK